MLEKLQINLSIFAAFVVTAFGLLMRIDPMRISFSLIIVIIAFYFFGLIIKAYLMSKVFVNQNVQDTSEKADLSVPDAQGDQSAYGNDLPSHEQEDEIQSGQENEKEEELY